MATFWVDGTRPDDTGPGTSYGTAKKTLAAGIALLTTKNDILNVVASGSYAWPLTGSEITIGSGVGTSFTDYGYLIRGVSDSSGTPAQVTIAASGGVSVRRFVQMNAGSGYIIFRNFTFDASALPTDGSVFTAVRYNLAGGPVWMDGCSIIGAAAGGVNLASMGVRQLVNVQNSNASLSGSRARYCLLQNAPASLPVLGGTLALEAINCIEYIDGLGVSGSSFLQRTLSSGTGAAFDVYSNTIYRSLNQASATPINCSVAGTNFGAMGVHSNLVYIESSVAGSADVEFLHDTTGGAVPWSGTIGYNGLFGGPSVPVGDLNSFGWYRGTFTTGGNPKATDQVAYGVAEATLFNNPAGTYAWDALGNGVTLTVPKDLRPRLYLTSSFTGGVLGALPAAQTDYAVTIATDNTAPSPGDTVHLTITHSNTGTSSTNVAAVVAFTSGMTVTGSSATVGSFAGNTWTIGSQASGASATLSLTCLVSASAVNGQDLSVSVAHSAGDPTVDSDSSNNSATVTITAVINPEDDPTQTPFLDVAPIYAPVLMAEINAIFRTRRNKITQHELRGDFEDRSWREFTGRRITVAPSTTLTVTSSIERADFLVLEATGAIEVSASAGDTDSYFPAATRLAVLDGSFSKLKLRNPSASASVDVLLVVID